MMRNPQVRNLLFHKGIFSGAVAVRKCEFFSGRVYMGVSKNRGGPPQWMVKIRENYEKMDDLGGKPLFLETPI